MTADRARQRALLVALVVVLVGVVWWNFLRPAASPAPARTAAAGARTSGPAGEKPTAIEPIALDALAVPRPHPAEGERNLFRFGERQEPQPAAAGPGGDDGGPGSAARVEDPAEPPVPAGPPPIPLRFVGLVERTQANRKIAVLSDGRNTFYGSEGDIIEGQYRILQIGVESVELAYIDGRGQQRLRLVGS